MWIPSGPLVPAVPVLAAALAGCGLLEPDDRTFLIFHVAAGRVECVGEAVGRCLRVRERPTDPWTLLHQPIVGFEPDEGHRYALLVERRAVADPPQDGSSHILRLVLILLSESVEPGADPAIARGRLHASCAGAGCTRSVLNP